jgi:uncharacterized membrane protein YgcG
LLPFRPGDIAGQLLHPPYLPAADGTCKRPPQQRPALSDQHCGNGLVPREAFRGDGVCVTQAVHDQTIADNVAAPTRTKPDGSCVPGFVWRESSLSDHICVLPATRAQTWSDNRRTCGDARCVVHVAPAQSAAPEHMTPATIKEHPRRNVFGPNRSRGGATSHRWTGHRTTTHAVSGHGVVSRSSGFRGGGFHGGGFHGGGFHGGGFHGGGGGHRR